ncbi:hypothetical protein N9954_08090 [Maribacter sp.]|nr:hypothetical protein [Maribacter sp.]
MKYKKVLLLFIFSIGIVQTAYTCTIFCGKDSNGHVWAGNNEDGLFNFKTYLNVFPKTVDTKYGYYTVSYNSPENGANSNAEGGMNEAGLFWDFNALDASGKQYPVKDLEKKKSFPKGDHEIYKHIMGNFDRVEEVVTFFEEYWFDIGFNTAQMHLADKYGGFAMIGPSGSRILKNEKYQVSTNFSICANDETYGCWRYPIAVEKLENNPIGLATFRDICQSTAQGNHVTTIYSNIQNLNTGEIWFYYALDYENPYRTTIADLLSKGRKSYAISSLFENNPLNQIMDRLKEGGSNEAILLFEQMKLSPKQKEGLLTIMAYSVADVQNNFEAYPFVEAYLAMNPEWRSLQTFKAMWQYFNRDTQGAIKTLETYKKLVPDTGLDVPRVSRRFLGKFDEDWNNEIELNGLQDAKYVLVKGLDRNTGNLLFKQNGKWVGKFKLPQGIHNYSFIVDGKEVFDTKTPIEQVTSVFSQKSFMSHRLFVGMTKEAYRTTIKVKVPNKHDLVHIAGNQTTLTDWNSVLKMKKTSDYEREITLDLHFPAVFKFTRGTWHSEAIVKGNEVLVNDEYYKPLQIDLDWDGSTFEIVNWKDRLPK